MKEKAHKSDIDERSISFNQYQLKKMRKESKISLCYYLIESFSLIDFRSVR